MKNKMMYKVEVININEQFAVEVHGRYKVDQAIMLAKQLVSEYEQREDADEFRIYIEHNGPAYCYINDLDGASPVAESWL